MTNAIAHYGAYAVFVIMVVDALVPFGGEATMLYAGALAAGAVAGHHATLFGVMLPNGVESYAVLSMLGSLGYLAGAVVGWAIGNRGGRAVIERHGRWLHLSPEAVRRADAWFARHGRKAVLLGRITPVVRSFISIPAGALGSPLASYMALTLLGSLLWCFALAGLGWALGASWESVHQDFRYADDVAVAAVVLFAAVALVSGRRLRHL